MWDAVRLSNCTNPGEERRLWINNNLALLSPALDTYQHAGLQVNVGLKDFVFQHNTVLMSDLSTIWDSIYFDATQNGCPSQISTQSGWILDKALTRQPAGDCYSPSSSGIPMHTADMGQPATPPLAQRYYGNVTSAPSGDLVQTWPGHFQLGDTTRSSMRTPPMEITACSVRIGRRPPTARFQVSIGARYSRPRTLSVVAWLQLRRRQQNVRYLGDTPLVCSNTPEALVKLQVSERTAVCSGCVAPCSPSRLSSPSY